MLRGRSQGWASAVPETVLRCWYSTGPVRRRAPAPTTTTRKAKHEPPQSVINFRNMQRRRGDTFRTDIRVERKAKQPPWESLRQHMFATSHKIASIASATDKDALSVYKEAEALLHERMQDWRALSRRIRAREKSPTPISPQYGVPSWNHVMRLAIRAASPTGAWHLYCEMKRQGMRPTPRTYAGFFHAMVSMVRDKKLETLRTPLWTDRLDKMYQAMEQLHTTIARASLEKHGAPSHQDQDMHPSSLATAYKAYITLLCTLGRYRMALEVFHAVCPDVYPGMAPLTEEERLPRRWFATVDMYTAMVRDLALCRMPVEERQELVRQVWRQWQDEVMQVSRRTGAALLDTTAIKTLVWALGMGRPHGDVQDVCAMLGRYMGVRFPSVPGMTEYVATDIAPLHFDEALLMDVLAFFDRREAYGCVIDVYAHAMTEASRYVDPRAVPEAQTLNSKAHAQLQRPRR